MDDFFSRKWLLVRYSTAFAVFPGGFGTVDEVGEITTLMQTKMLPGAPIVLIGTAYWAPFLEWINESAIKQGLIPAHHAHMIACTDDVQEAAEMLCTVCFASN